MAMITLRFTHPKCLVALLLAYLLVGGSTVYASENAIHLKFVSYDVPPYIIANESEPKGLAIQYVKALMERADTSFDIMIMPPKRSLIYTLSTPNTCVFPIERTQEREVKLSWISPITISRYGLFSHPEQTVPPIRVLNDLQDMRIGSHLGSAMGEYMTSLEFNVDNATENRANLDKLMADRIDIWMSEILSANYIAEQKGIDLGEPELVFFTTIGAIGCNLNIAKSTIKKLNHSLQEMYRDGTIERITNAFEKQNNP